MRAFLSDLRFLFQSLAAPFRQFWRWNGLKALCVVWAAFAGSALALPALLALLAVSADVARPFVAIGLDRLSGGEAASALGGAIAEAGVGKFLLASACVAWGAAAFAVSFSYAFGAVLAGNMARAVRGEKILVLEGNPWLDARKFARFAGGLACMAPFALAAALAWAAADLAAQYAFGVGSFYSGAVSPALKAGFSAFVAVRLWTWPMGLADGAGNGGKSPWRLVSDGWALPRGRFWQSWAAWAAFGAAYWLAYRFSQLALDAGAWPVFPAFLLGIFGLWETGLAALRERLLAGKPGGREAGRDL